MMPTEKVIHRATVVFCDLWSLGLDEVCENNSSNYRAYSISDFRYDTNFYLSQRGFRVDNGCSKIVIDFGDDDWVLKFEMFCDRHFCEKEAENYKEAVARGLGRFFTETYEIGEIHGIKLFLQEKVTPNEDLFSDRKSDYVRNMFPMYSEEEVEDYMWEMDEDEIIESVFGDVADMNKLSDFIWDTIAGKGLSPDLHEGNFGIAKDGRYVIFDFSGY